MSEQQSTINDEAELKLSETEVVVVLDRSGSMRSISAATVAGYNSFIEEQRLAEGNGYLTLIQFADRDSYAVTYKSTPLAEVHDLILNETYLPTGSATALRDAIGRTINELKTDRDVVFMIITDGLENDSREYTQDAIKKMIETMEGDKKWKFMYLGANQDAFAVGQSYGVKGTNSMTYSADNEHVEMAFASAGSNVRSMRNAKSTYLASMKLDDTITYSAATMDFLEKDLSFSDLQRSASVK